MSDDIAIKVDGVSKTFKLPHERHSSIKTALINIGRTKRGYEKQHVLKNISFEIKKGEFFGIVGRNGSGKSTLLKLLAGIYTPDKGTITVNGKLTPFIELGVGFNPELSGRENVFLNGALLGFSRKEMEAMYDEIVEFAELERFMDQKLKNYSSGMQVRLAFSIAIRVNTDILVLDEVLAVGDEAFQRRCYGYFAQLRKSKKTVILVTHDMNAAQTFCNRALLVEKGDILLTGEPRKVAARYSELNLSTQEKSSSKKKKKLEHIQRWGDGSVEMQFSLLDEFDNKLINPSPGQIMHINIRAKVMKRIIDPRIGIVIQNKEGLFVFASNTQVEDVKVNNKAIGQEYNVTFIVENIFTDGDYSISGAIASNYDETVYDRIESALTFETGGWRLKHAQTHPRHEIIIK